MAGAVKWFDEFLVNTIQFTDGENFAEGPAGIAALPTGGFVVSWAHNSAIGTDTTGDAISAQIYTADGSKLGGEFQVNTTTVDQEVTPSITVLEDGRFVIAYEYFQFTGGNSSQGGTVLARIFNPDGTESKPEFTIQGSLNGTQSFSPTVATLIDGRWIAAWTGFDGSPGDQGVQAGIFNGNEAQSATAFVVNNPAINPQSFPAIAAAKDGGFVVAFADDSTSPATVRTRIFQNDDTPAAPDFLVGTTIGSGFGHIAIAELQSGRFVVAWDTDPVGNDPSDVHAKMYESNGAPVGSEFTVNTTTAGTQQSPALAALPDGRFVAAWTDSSAHISGGVRGQVFNADGSKSGAEFLTDITDDASPSITVLTDGRFVITSKAFSQQTGVNVHEQIFDPRDGIVTGTGSGETLYGNDLLNDQITGLGGNDTLLGYGGNDTLNGGPGNDTIDGGAGTDTAVFSGLRSAYTLTNSVNGLVVSGSDGVDTLKNVEFLGFDDMTIAASVNSAPTITSNGGGDNATVSIQENTNAVTTVAATDPDAGTTLAYSIVGGADAGQFAINGSSGALSFVTAPNFEMPTDSDHNNSYIVQVGASDGSLFDNQTITVSVTDIPGLTIVGDGNDNTLTGTIENDTISGLGGNDTIDGGSDNDLIFAGAGHDTVNGGDGNDTLVGNDDPFASEPDTLNGGNGNDTLYVESSDTFSGGPGRDFVYVVNSNPIHIDLGATSIEWISSDFGDDVIDGSTQTVGVEIYSDGGNDTITGSAFDDIIWSGSGNDTVTGGDGNDVIVGDIGADSISGGNGNDSLYVDASDTLIDGGAGFDAAYITAGASMTIDLAATHIEFVADFVPGGSDDTIDGSGTSVNLEVYAGAGTDTVKGGSGNDFLWGEAGNDTVTGGSGNDTLVGGLGADTLTGGPGIDALYGNSGNGGDGAVDTFVFTDNWGTDFVFDFDHGTDKIDVSAVTGLNSFADFTVTNTPDGHCYLAFNGNLIAVANHTTANLTAGDFIF